MKNLRKHILIAASFIALLICSCVKEDDLAVPNLESPVLVLVSGSSFSATSNVSVTARIYELDKTNILDHTRGIDSIAVSNLQILVLSNNFTEVASFTTDAEGKITLDKTWEELGLSAPKQNNIVRLEFSGIYKNINFRKMHTVTVKD